MHYVDEGPRGGRPVVLLHGNPTWGYLYRNFIPPLVDAGHRVIVPDYLGFGRSDKPDDPELYRIERHCQRIELLLESLDLQDACVVVHDWGGVIGLNWATNHPQRVAGLFIMNTHVHRPPGKVRLPLPIRLFRTPIIGEVMIKGLHIFVRGLVFRVGVVKRERLTADVKRAYLAPHPSWSTRTPILVFPREIPSGSEGRVADLGGEIERRLESQFRQKPVMIAWALKDIAFKEYVLDQFWLKTFPDAKVLRIPDAGHYLQEDAHEVIAPALVDFLASI